MVKDINISRQNILNDLWFYTFLFANYQQGVPTRWKKNKAILEEEHRYKMNQDVTTNKIIIIIIFITYYNFNSNYFQVAVEIAEQFIALAETNPNYTAINGVLNAPALAASRNPENSSLIALAKSLGKLAGELLRSAAFSSISFSLETQGELTPFFF